MATRTPAELIAKYRKQAAAAGEPIDHLSDTEVALRELDAMVASYTHLNTLHGRMLQEQVQHDRDVYTAAERKAQDDRMAWRDLYIDALVRKGMYAINGLIHQASELPDRPKPAQVETLRRYARDARVAVAAKPSSEALESAERWRLETWRLRDYITAAGQAMHADCPRGEVCGCGGAELIRGMDEPTIHTARTETEQEKQ